MIELNGYEDVQPVMPGEFLKLPADGYVCQIFSSYVTNSRAGDPMLVLCVDVAEGEFAGFFKASADRVKNFRADVKWDNSAVYRQLIFDKDGKTSKFFKGLLACFEKSNSNFKVNPRSFDEKNLRGLLIGFVFAEEEYQKRDGSIASRVFVKFPRTVADIRNGNFSLPEVKKFSPPATTQPKDDFDGTSIDDSDIPF